MDEEREGLVRARQFALVRDIEDLAARIDELDRFTGRLRATTGTGKEKHEVGFHKAAEELDLAKKALFFRMGWKERRKRGL